MHNLLFRHKNDYGKEYANCRRIIQGIGDRKNFS